MYKKGLINSHTPGVEEGWAVVRVKAADEQATTSFLLSLAGLATPILNGVRCSH